MGLWCYSIDSGCVNNGPTHDNMKLTLGMVSGSVKVSGYILC